MTLSRFVVTLTGLAVSVLFQNLTVERKYTIVLVFITREGVFTVLCYNRWYLSVVVCDVCSYKYTAVCSSFFNCMAVV